MSWTEALLLLLAGGVAGFLNVLSAGGSMLTLPALMFMGLDSATANGTNRVSIVLQSVSAAWKFRRSGHNEWRLALRLSVPTVIGSLVGAWLATLVGDAVFRWLLIGIMVLMSVLMLMPMRSGVQTRRLESGTLDKPLVLALLLIGFYGGFIQVGVGILFLVLLHRVLHFDLIQVNILKVLIILIYTLPALGVFIASGNVHWGYGLVVALGSMVGAWLGAQVSLGANGARWIRFFTLAIIAVIILRLALE